MPKPLTESSITNLSAQAGFEVLDRATFPGRAATYAPIPEALDERIRTLLARDYPDGIYRHQARSLETLASGRDVCLATSTASGKSLVFMTAALDILLRDRFARVLAFYPAKALIQDQIDKWRAFLDPFGIRLGYIDGTVPTERRAEILNGCRVVLMTPDVTHAWLMSHVGDRPIREFLSRLRLLVLDEAHVYDGVFGTNMAYFLRRLEAVAAPHRLIASTATIGDAAAFIQQLTGRNVEVVGPESDGSGSPEKTVLRLRSSEKDRFDCAVQLLVALSRVDSGRFLAFGDSRKMVERIVAATLRARKDEQGNGGDDRQDDSDDVDDSEVVEASNALVRILPYRAGYEANDRNAIQKALSNGGLAGVVSTSALEMGIDIGEIDVVVLLNTPPNVKSFRQRIGRAGRKRAAVCLVLDDDGTMGSLDEYLQRPIEPSWLYLQNRYIQYANALCAASELRVAGKALEQSAFASLPDGFTRLVENELNPTEMVAGDLYALKQRAQGGAHAVSPLRSAMEQEFKVNDGRGLPLGTLTLSQALREAYPGAVHYYMARAYRVFNFQYRNGDIRVKRCRQWTTRPLAQAVVFPRFQGGVLTLLKSSEGFVAEAELQVSERVTGFVEQRGKTKIEHLYGPNSEFYQKEITRFYLTTGVCWYFPDRFTIDANVAGRLLEAFCAECGIQSRDLGVGTFRAKVNPLMESARSGICIYDATNGSLRLTQLLADRFSDVVRRAIAIAEERSDDAARIAELKALLRLAEGLAPASPMLQQVPMATPDDFITVVAPGEKAIYASPDGAMEVIVLGCRYTPQELLYELRPPKNGVKWMAAVAAVTPLNGDSVLARYNLMTGEFERTDAPEAAIA